MIALVTLAAGFLQVGPPTAQGSPQTPSRAESSAPGDTAGVGTLGYTLHDGSLDLSDFIDEPYGFLPIAAPITEPAVGYGLYGGPVFIGEASHRSDAGFGRPNVTFAGGAQASYRLGRSCFWAGLGYVLAFFRVEFKIPDEVTCCPTSQGTRDKAGS